MAKDKLELATSVCVDTRTGELLAVYFQIRNGTAARVEEKCEGAVFVNYDKRDRLLGVEMLAPCSVRVFDSIARDVPMHERAPVRRFLKSSVPREMVAC